MIARARSRYAEFASRHRGQPKWDQLSTDVRASWIASEMALYPVEEDEDIREDVPF